MRKLKIPRVSVFRPGAILDRENDDRLIEKIFKYVPFFPKISAVDIARCMMQDAERVHDEYSKNNSPNTVTYVNDDLLKMVKWLF